MEKPIEHNWYLGDGVFVQDDGYHFWLITEPLNREERKIALGPDELLAFFKYIERARNLSIKITKLEKKDA